MPSLEPDARLTQFYGDTQVYRTAIGTPNPVATHSETHRLSEEAKRLADGVGSAARALRRGERHAGGGRGKLDRC